MSLHSVWMSDVGLRSLAVSFSSLNCPLRALNKHRNKPFTRANLNPPGSSSSSLQLSSSHPVRTDETKNSSEIFLENTVGIIGGVSVLSTLIFLEKLIFWSSRDGGTSVHFIVCSDSMLRSALSFQESVLDQNQTDVVDNLRRKRAFLEEGGAKCIAMPCHVSHVWYGEISQGCKLHFLHVGDCVVMELKEARLKPLEAGCGVKIGVIATGGALVARVYEEKLLNEGFEVVLPDRATTEHIINPAVKSMNRKDREGAQNLLRIAIQILLVRAANVVILASDELQGLLPHDDPLSKKCIDPMDSLARSTARWAKSIKVLDKSSHVA